MAKVAGLLLKESKTQKKNYKIDKLLELEEQITSEDGESEAVDKVLTKKDDEKYEDVSFIPFGKGWNATKVSLSFLVSRFSFLNFRFSLLFIVLVLLNLHFIQILELLKKKLKECEDVHKAKVTQP